MSVPEILESCVIMWIVRGRGTLASSCPLRGRWSLTYCSESRNGECVAWHKTKTETYSTIRFLPAFVFWGTVETTQVTGIDICAYKVKLPVNHEKEKDLCKNVKFLHVPDSLMFKCFLIGVYVIICPSLDEPPKCVCWSPNTQSFIMWLC